MLNGNGARQRNRKRAEDQRERRQVKESGRTWLDVCRKSADSGGAARSIADGEQRRGVESGWDVLLVGVLCKLARVRAVSF